MNLALRYRRCGWSATERQATSTGSLFYAALVNQLSIRQICWLPLNPVGVAVLGLSRQDQQRADPEGPSIQPDRTDPGLTAGTGVPAGMEGSGDGDGGPVGTARVGDHDPIWELGPERTDGGGNASPGVATGGLSARRTRRRGRSEMLW